MNNVEYDEGGAAESAPHAQRPAEASTRFLMLGCGRMGGALLDCWHAIDAFDLSAISPLARASLPCTPTPASALRSAPPRRR